MKAITKDNIEVELEYSSIPHGPSKEPYYGQRVGTTYLFGKINDKWHKSIGTRSTIEIMNKMKDIQYKDLLGNLFESE